MGLIIALVFVGVFAIIALPLIASSMGPSRNARQALATLDAVIRAENPVVQKQIVDLRKSEQVSSIPWLDKRLHNLEVVPYLRNVLSQAAVNWSPGRLMVMTGVAFAVPCYLVYLEFGIFLAALGAGIVVGLLPFGWVMFMRSKRFAKFEARLPECLDLMVSALRAGHSLIAAMGLVSRECAAPVGSEFKICFEEQNYGLEMKTALDNLLHRMPLQDLRIVVTAILIQKESGGNLAEVLDKTSYLIRERFRLKRQIKTHTAQGRLTGWVLTLVPVALGFAMYMANPKMMSILWHRSIGIKLMWAAGGMILIGGFIINRIVDIDV